MSWMIERAAELKAAAAARRARGQHVGKLAPGWNAKRCDPAAGSWGRLVAETKSRWSFVRGEAIQQFQIDVYGDPLADFVA
jgi:hypothetical protein